ncbi:hypothetical protein Tco_0569863 [Tanacetum coccineum]
MEPYVPSMPLLSLLSLSMAFNDKTAAHDAMAGQIITFAAMARKMIAFAAMARQMIAFAAMARQMITFAAMAGKIITFASMLAISVLVVDDYQTRALIYRHIFLFLASACRSKVSWRAYLYFFDATDTLLSLSVVCDDSDTCVTIAMTKGEIYVECDSVVVCELLLGLRPWHLKSDYWYTIICDCVCWCRCDEAGMAMMSLLVGRNKDKAICILAWQLAKVAAMTYVVFAHPVLDPGFNMSSNVVAAQAANMSLLTTGSLMAEKIGVLNRQLESKLRHYHGSVDGATVRQDAEGKRVIRCLEEATKQRGSEQLFKEAMEDGMNY